MRELDLLDSLEIQRTIVDNVPTMVLVLDEQGRIAKVNGYFEHKTGYTADAIIGKDWFSTFIPDEVQPEIQELFAAVLERGSNPGHVNSILTADGRRLEIEWFARVITDPGRRERWLLNVGHDITDRLEYEKALASAKREAERADAAKSRFLASASHDLRQPLQTLVVLNEGLTRLAQDAEQQKILGMQRDALTGMRQLLNTLLDIGKLESGAIQPEFAAVAVQHVFERLSAELKPLAAEKGLDLVVEDTMLVANTDETLLTELMQNVVGNAIRYTSQGSIRLACKPLEAGLEISVADTGIGIGEDQLELIFDEFYQVDRQVSNGGLGLGLSIVKRIAGLLDCEIAIDSEPGKGTTFRLCVPAAVGAQPSSRKERRASEPAGRTGTILLVDDDAVVLAASQFLFEVEGFDVIAAASPDEVADKLDSNSVPLDLVVTDYHLCDRQTGIDVIDAVRERYSQAIPAILMTGDTSPPIDRDLPRLELLTKPCEPEQLLATIQHLLDEAAGNISVVDSPD